MHIEPHSAKYLISMHRSNTMSLRDDRLDEVCGDVARVGEVDAVAAHLGHNVLTKQHDLLESTIIIYSTGNLYKAAPRLRECRRQVEVEVVSNSRNKIH